MQGNRYTGPVINVAYPEQTREAAAAIEAYKAECYERYKRCKAVLERGSQAARQWLETLDESERQKCRWVLNNMREGRKQ